MVSRFCCDVKYLNGILSGQNLKYTEIIQKGALLKPVVWGPKKYQRYVTRRTRRQHIVSGIVPLPVHNAIVWPDERPQVAGIYDTNGRFVKDSSIMTRTHRRHWRKVRVPDNIEYIDRDVVFLGNMHWLFGHFLLKRLNRLYAVQPDMDCVFLYRRATDPMPKYVREFLDMMGVDAGRVHIVRHPTRFRSVIVPPRAQDDDFTSRVFSDTFDKMQENLALRSDATEIAAPEKIYVSRDALKLRRTFGEDSIQRIFEKNGFTIIRPETMSLAHQAMIMRRCRVLAGCAGTALHLAFFMPRGGHVVQIKRNSKVQDYCDAQNIVNMTRGHRGDFIWASVETLKTDHRITAPQIIGFTSYMLDFLGQNGLRYTNDDVQNATQSTEFAQYQVAVAEFKKSYGGVVQNKIKHAIIKIMACCIPGRARRGRFRTTMKRRWLPIT